MEPAAAAAQSSRPSRLRDLAAACAPFPHGFYSAAVATQLCQQCSLCDGGASSAAFRTVPVEDGCALCELRWWDEGEVQKWCRRGLRSFRDADHGNLVSLVDPTWQGRGEARSRAGSESSERSAAAKVRRRDTPSPAEPTEPERAANQARQEWLPLLRVGRTWAAHICCAANNFVTIDGCRDAPNPQEDVTKWCLVRMVTEGAPNVRFEGDFVRFEGDYSRWLVGAQGEWVDTKVRSRPSLPLVFAFWSLPCHLCLSSVICIGRQFTHVFVEPFQDALVTAESSFYGDTKCSIDIAALDTLYLYKAFTRVFTRARTRFEVNKVVLASPVALDARKLCLEQISPVELHRLYEAPTPTHWVSVDVMIITNSLLGRLLGQPMRVAHAAGVLGRDRVGRRTPRVHRYVHPPRPAPRAASDAAAATSAEACVLQDGGGGGATLLDARETSGEQVLKARQLLLAKRTVARFAAERKLVDIPACTSAYANLLE